MEGAGVLCWPGSLKFECGVLGCFCSAAFSDLSAFHYDSFSSVIGKECHFFFFSFLTVTPEGDGTAQFCYHCHLASFVVHLFIVGFISKLKTERRHTYKVSELDFGPVRVEFGPLVGRLR